MTTQTKQPTENKIVFLSPETHKTLKVLAAKRGVTMRKVVEQVLEDYLISSKK